MKSLETLIREIQEGKTEKSEKKTLESSIRNIMSKESSFAAKDSKPVDEHCGCEDEKKKKISKEDGDKLPGAEDKMDEEISAIGTDKYQGNQFKSVRTSTPHISPPGKIDSSHGHSQAPENVSRQRTLAKEKGSMTVHGKVTEGKVDLAIKGVSKLADTVMDTAKPYVASKSKQLVPYVSKELQTATKAAPAAAEKLPVPVKAPETKLPAVVAPPKIETKTETKPQVPVVTPTATATKPAPVSVPKTETKPAPAVPPKGGAPVVPPKGGKPGLPGPGFRLPRFADISGPQYVGKPWIEAPWKVHGTKAERHFRESVEDRKKIEDMPRKNAGERPTYVGRNSDDPKTTAEKTSRQAQYKIKIIDESKKLASIIKKTTKEYESGGKTKVFDRGEDIIVINPDLNKNSLDTKQ